MIKEKKFRSFKKFWCFIEELNAQNNNFIWRGHSNKNWILNTTWNRYRKIFNDIEMTETLIKFEQNLARGGFFPFKEPVSKYQWLELARHYGIPTPLIDFSYSPYIALFFACSEVNNTFEKKQAVLYALNISELSIAVTKFFCDKYKIDAIFFDKIRENFLNGSYSRQYGENFWVELKQLSDIEDENTRNEEIKKSFIFNSDDNIEIEFFPNNELFFIPHPSSFNKRMIKQHGCFLYDSFEYKPYQIYGNNLEDFINKINCSEPILYKLYFPLSFVSDILYRLDLMNINGVNLYMDEIGAVIDTKNMKNYNSVFGLNDSKIIKDENV